MERGAVEEMYCGPGLQRPMHITVAYLKSTPACQ